MTKIFYAILILVPSAVLRVSLAFALRVGRTDTVGAPIRAMTYGPPEFGAALPPAIALAAVIASALFGTSLARRLLQRRRPRRPRKKTAHGEDAGQLRA
jgi:hypothetical protein